MNIYNHFITVVITTDRQHERRTTWPEGATVRQKLWGWMPGGAAEDVPVCLVLAGTASVTAIEQKKTLVLL